MEGIFSSVNMLFMKIRFVGQTGFQFLMVGKCISLKPEAVKVFLVNPASNFVQDRVDVTVVTFSLSSLDQLQEVCGPDVGFVLLLPELEEQDVSSIDPPPSDLFLLRVPVYDVQVTLPNPVGPVRARQVVTQREDRGLGVGHQLHVAQRLQHGLPRQGPVPGWRFFRDYLCVEDP